MTFLTAAIALLSLVVSSVAQANDIRAAAPALETYAQDRLFGEVGKRPGLSPRDIGSTFGENQVSLNASEMPTHSHSLTVFAQPDDGKRSGAPENGSGLAVPRDSSPYADPGALATFAPGMIGLSGGGQPHENRQPFLALGFCIAMAGIFPQFG